MAQRPPCSTAPCVLEVKHTKGAFSFMYPSVHLYTHTCFPLSRHGTWLAHGGEAGTCGGWYSRAESQGRSKCLLRALQHRMGVPGGNDQPVRQWRAGLCDTGKSLALIPVCPAIKLSLFRRCTGHAVPCNLSENPEELLLGTYPVFKDPTMHCAKARMASVPVQSPRV